MFSTTTAEKAWRLSFMLAEPQRWFSAGAWEEVDGGACFTERNSNK